MRLFAPVIALVLIEIALFITIGGKIGLLASLALIFSSAMLGVWVLRSASVRAAGNLRAAMSQMGSGIRNPDFGAGDHALLMLAGVLLILPGFMGDMLGLVLLLSPMRAMIRRAVLRRVQIVTTERRTTARRSDGAIVIDGEFIELDDPKENPAKPETPPSGWTRH